MTNLTEARGVSLSRSALDAICAVMLPRNNTYVSIARRTDHKRLAALRPSRRGAQIPQWPVETPAPLLA
jgi:hypothetical protein